MSKLQNKKAQMKLSFGMIFSIILIIVFLGFAIYAITLFLGVVDSTKIGKFSDDLRGDVNKVWKSSQASQEVEYSLPGRIEKVCFVDYSSEPKSTGDTSLGNESLYNRLKQVYYGEESLFFYPLGSGKGLDALIIEHINIKKITKDENPFCIDVEKEKVKMTLKKDYNETLVTITGQ
jgi:hypothetical protein